MCVCAYHSAGFPFSCNAAFVLQGDVGIPRRHQGGPAAAAVGWGALQNRPGRLSFGSRMCHAGAVAGWHALSGDIRRAARARWSLKVTPLQVVTCRIVLAWALS